MTWTNPNTPNLPDFLQWVQNSMGVPPSALPPPLTAPAAAALTAGTGGSLPAGAVYVTLTLVSVYGETTASTEANVTVAASGSVGVGSPTTQINATGYNVYASDAAGKEVLQNASPIAIGTAYTINSLTTGTASAPTVNTSGSPWPGYALAQAESLTIPAPYGMPGVVYTLATYNSAGHILLKITPDVAGGSFFSDLRSQFNLLAINPGLVSAASDQGTSDSLVVPDFVKGMTFLDLDFARTPYGREMLAYNQDFGPTVVGLS